LKFNLLFTKCVIYILIIIYINNNILDILGCCFKANHKNLRYIMIHMKNMEIKNDKMLFTTQGICLLLFLWYLTVYSVYAIIPRMSLSASLEIFNVWRCNYWKHGEYDNADATLQYIIKRIITRVTTHTPLLITPPHYCRYLWCLFNMQLLIIK